MERRFGLGHDAGQCAVGKESPQIPQVTAQMGNLEVIISEMRGVVSDIEQRLGTVLRAGGPETMNKEAAGTSPTLTPLAQAISDNNRVLHSLVLSLRDVLDRIEL